MRYLIEVSLTTCPSPLTLTEYSEIKSSVLHYELFVHYFNRVRNLKDTDLLPLPNFLNQ